MRKVLLVAAALAVCLAASPASAYAWELTPRWFEPLAPVSPASLTTPPAVVSLAGADRVVTAVLASRQAFPGKAPAVVLCTGWNWPDALGGAALAGAKGGPLLLTRPDVLPSAVASEVVRLDAREVVILGAESAVSSRVADALGALAVNGHGLAVTRLGGAHRYLTSALVASATVAALRDGGRTYDGTAFFATSRTFPDALAAAPLAARKGWPILIVGASGLSTATEDAVASLGISRGIMLGSASAVTTTVAGRLAELLPAPPERLQGADRYATALAIARFGVANGLAWNGLAVTTGQDFPDALAGGVMQGKLGSVLLTTPGRFLDFGVYQQLASVRGSVYTVRYIGGTGTLRQYCRDGVMAALTGKPYPTQNGMIFPVDGPCEYEDTFGAPRSGGRTHEGCDIMAARNTPEVACVNGIVTTRVNTLGGNCVYLDGDNGWRFYYAHMERWAVTSGQHVQAGQRVGYVGNSGNASGGATHLHIQMWKPDGTLVNPYPYLRQMLR